MRRIKVSKTFASALDQLLSQGEPKFGTLVVDKKRKQVRATIEDLLAIHPYAKQPDPLLGLRIYPISRTPFVVLYDFDDAELRVHFVFHRHASLADLDPTSAEW